MIIEGELGGIIVGEGHSVAVAAIINLSRGSFYKRSVKIEESEIREAGLAYQQQGASFIDIGAVSTAPVTIYGKRESISIEEEKRLIKRALRVLQDCVEIPISVDTQRSEVAELALSLGAEIINDVSGFNRDEEMARVVAEYDGSVILMAYNKEPGDLCSINKIREALSNSINKAVRAGVKPKKIVVDPGIGFGKPVKCDVEIIASLRRLYTLGRPIMVSASRKNFIGRLLGDVPPEKRLYGSIGAAAIAVYNGAHVIRTHDVKETVEAIRVAEATRKKLSHFSVGDIEIEELSFLRDKGDISHVIEQVGIDSSQAMKMVDKGLFHILLLRNLTPSDALILKQTFLALGGEVAVHRDVIDFKVGRTDAVIMATERQLKRALASLKSQAFNLPIIAELIERIMAG